MENLKVIFRKTKDGEIIAFFPEASANFGNVLSYMHIGQHGEASMEFYQITKKATEAEYKPLLKELKVIYYDYNLIIKQKINYHDLRKAWKIAK